MLNILSSGYTRTCQTVSRREFFRIGTLGSLSLAGLLAARSRAAEAGVAVRDKSIVVLFLGGGAPHIETFDPKMSAPAEFRSIVGEVQTDLPGVTFGGCFPKLARLASKMAVVRSFQHGNTDHNVAPGIIISGNNPTRSMLGSVYAKVAGSLNPSTGMPTNVMLTPPAVGASGNFFQYPKRLTPVGSLGAGFAPFDPSSGGELKRNMELKIPRERFDNRVGLLKAFDQVRREADRAPEGGEFRQQAIDVILRGASSAFDLGKEDQRVLARYDTGHIHVPAGSTLNRSKEAQPEALGKQMLLARRLCEAGCGFVTVTSNGWDWHTAGDGGTVQDGMEVMGRAVDHAVSAFLEDLEDRGLSEKILLVITGDFGRHPRIGKGGGRDHWGNLCTLALAGGGLKMGQVIGTSNARAEVPASEPVTVENLAATMLHTLFDPGILRLQPKDAAINDFLASAEPIRQLF